MERRQKLRRPTKSRILYGIVVIGGSLVLALSVGPAIDFVASAPREFWFLAALAVLADARPFTLPRPTPRRTQIILSLCFSFAILLVWGPAPAVFVQTVAAAVGTVRMRLTSKQGSFLTARLLCSLAAAGIVSAVVGATSVRVGVGIDRHDLPAILLPATAFWLVNLGIGAAAVALTNRTSGRGLASALAPDLLGTGALLLLAPVLVVAPTGWSVALIAVPVLALAQVARLLTEQDRRLNQDPVTGTLSRRGLVAETTTLAEMSGPGTARFGLVLVDLRGVGYVNENLGRATAELVLREAAHRLRGAIHEGDKIGRLGGYDFALLRPGLTMLDAPVVATAVSTALRDPVEVAGLPFLLEPAVGVSVSPDHGSELSVLVTNAEAAILEAAARGATIGVFATQVPSVAHRRLALLSDLRSALQDPTRADQIALRYQPQVALDTGRVVGVEALVRWTHPEHGPIPPDELIAAVEPSAVMHFLTERIIDEVVAQLSHWNDQGLDMRAAANISVRDVCVDGFDQWLRETLAQHKVRPDQLGIEVTEGSFIEDSPMLVEAACRIAAVGVSLSLDDFGTGYASLRQLRQLPLTEIKIDRSYINAMTTSAADRAFVRAIHQLACALGVRLVAEGVEDALTARMLGALRGTVGQGWYFGRPMTQTELLEWLSQRGEFGLGRDWPGESVRL